MLFVDSCAPVGRRRTTLVAGLAAAAFSMPGSAATAGAAEPAAAGERPAVDGRASANHDPRNIMRKALRQRYRRGLVGCTLRRDCRKKVRVKPRKGLVVLRRVRKAGRVRLVRIPTLRLPRREGRVTTRSGHLCDVSGDEEVREICRVLTGGDPPVDPDCDLVPGLCPVDCLADKLPGGQYGDEDGDLVANGLEFDVAFLSAVADLPLLLSPCDPDSDEDRIEDGRDLVGEANQDDGSPDTGLNVELRISSISIEDAQRDDVTLDDAEPGNGDPYLSGDSLVGSGNITSAFGTAQSLDFRRLTFSDHQDDPADVSGPFELARPIELSEDVLDWRKSIEGGTTLAGLSKFGLLDGTPLGAPSIGIVALPLDHDTDCNNDVFAPGEPYLSYCGTGLALLPQYDTLDILIALVGAGETVSNRANSAGDLPGPEQDPALCPELYGIKVCFAVTVTDESGDKPNGCALGLAAATWRQSEGDVEPQQNGLLKDIPTDLRC